MKTLYSNLLTDHPLMPVFSLSILTLLLTGPLAISGCTGDATSTHDSTAEHTESDGHTDDHDEHDDHDDQGSAEITLSGQALAAVEIETIDVQPRPVGSVHQYNGRVVPIPDQEAMVTSMIGGRLERVLVNEGDRVRAGQTVAVISGPEIGQLVAEMQHAGADLATQKRLDERGVGIRKKLVEAQTVFNEAQHHLRSIGMTEDEIAAIASGENNPDGLSLKSPASGIVVARDATRGGPVEAGQVLFHIADLTPIWVEADVYERDLGTIMPGGTVTVHTVAGTSQRSEGIIRQVLPGIDRDRRVSVVQIQIDNRDSSLQPEMFVTVNVSSGSEIQPAVPVDAIMTDGIESFVIVAENDSTFRRVDIEASVDAAGNVAVPELPVGTRVVTTGAFQIHSAMSGVEAGHAH